jgi:hypothetical protein
MPYFSLFFFFFSLEGKGREETQFFLLEFWNRSTIYWREKEKKDRRLMRCVVFLVLRK